MLVSINEISKYVDLKGITPEEIADKLTSAGIEVETIKHLSTATNLVIGHIIKCDKHPESDHLHVNQVDIGSEVLQIVCGAPNCRLDLKVIVAKDGAKLPDKEIKKSTIRGIDSCGMLCALNEIGVDPKDLRKEQIEGIEELPEDAPVGETKVLKYLGLDDVILDLSLLANRSDAYSLYNVAKEIGSLFDRKVTIPSYISNKLVDNKYIVNSLTEKCKVFSIRFFGDVKTQDSPKSLQSILRNEGIRSIDNIVDIGNYVMLLSGQPINMYDADKLPKKELIVRDDFEGDVVAMDDKTYSIKKGDIVITSDNKVMCIAGIMTCKCCEVTKDSKNIIVESANFYGPQIRKTCIRLGISSDSSQRFVKGINPNQTNEVMELVTHFMSELAKYLEVSKTNSYNVLNYKDKEIPCTFSYINNRLGTSFTNKDIINTLNKLYIVTKNVDDNGFIAVIPSSRIDIEGKADLSEEVIRYNGFSKIESTLPLMETTVGTRSEFSNKSKCISDYLLSSGLDRIVTYTLINKEDKDSFNLVNKNDGYEIINPLTEDHKYIRTNLLSSLLRTVQYNFNHQNKNFGLFEISQINDKKENSYHLSICLFGKKFTQDELGETPYTFYDMKGYLEGILELFNIQPSRIRYDRLLDSKELHPNRSVKVTLDGKTLAVMGDIYPTLKSKYDLKKEETILLEMNLSLLFGCKTGNNHFNDFNKFPSVSRDYAFVINDDVKFSDIKNDIKKLSSLISEIHIFDIYEGEKLEPNKVSIALRVMFDGKDHTLNDKEISEVDSKIRELISTKFKGSIRA